MTEMVQFTRSGAQNIVNKPLQRSRKRKMRHNNYNKTKRLRSSMFKRSNSNLMQSIWNNNQVNKTFLQLLWLNHSFGQTILVDKQSTFVLFFVCFAVLDLALFIVFIAVFISTLIYFLMLLIFYSFSASNDMLCLLRLACDCCFPWCCWCFWGILRAFDMLKTYHHEPQTSMVIYNIIILILSPWIPPLAHIEASIVKMKNDKKCKFSIVLLLFECRMASVMGIESFLFVNDITIHHIIW